MQFATNTKSITLPNKLKVLYHIDHNNPIVCIQLHIKAGSFLETEHEKGFCHFIEHLSFKPEGDIPSVTDEVPRLGGMINAYTDFDSTCYYLLLPSEHLARGLEILAVLASGASFTAGDVKLEKDIIIEEIKQYENEPEIDFIEFIQANYFDRNPLKYPVLGTLASLKHATYPALRAFYDRYYVPGKRC